MNNNPPHLAAALAKRTENASLRRLLPENTLADFASNDYLGLARSELLRSRFLEKLHRYPHINGAGGSRLLRGNSSLHEHTEAQLAAFHGSEAALLFSSGFEANVGLMSCMAQRGDHILYDEYCHASIRDGLRLSFAHTHAFRHNDMEQLKEQLQKLKGGQVYIVAESLYSMDGDFAPLHDLVALAQQYGAWLVIDEAHTNGIYGEAGAGWVQAQGLADAVWARVHTFGKAVGSSGATIVGTALLRQYLINYCRNFIYTTAVPLHQVLHIQTAYELLPEFNKARKQLQAHIHLFQREMPAIAVHSPIISQIIGGNEATRAAAHALQEQGFDVRPILYPTVPQGSERLRISLHSFNSEEEIKNLIKNLHLPN